MNEKQKGFFALLGAAVMYSLAGPLIRTMDSMYGNYSQVVIRTLIPLLVVSVIVYFSKKKNKINSSEKIFAILLGVGRGLVTIFFTLAILNAKLADVIFIYYAGSAIVAFVVGTFLYKEAVNFQKILMLFIFGMGLYIYVGSVKTLSFGLLMALLSGVFDGITNVIRKKIKGAGRYEIMIIQFLFAGIIAIIVMLCFSSEPIIKETSLVPIIATLIFAVTVVKVNDLLLYGFARYDVNAGTVILASEIFFMTAIGYVFFAEILTVHEWIGGILIFCASVIGGVDFTKLVKKVRVKGER